MGFQGFNFENNLMLQFLPFVFSSFRQTLERFVFNTVSNTKERIKHQQQTEKQLQTARDLAH